MSGPAFRIGRSVRNGSARLSLGDVSHSASALDSACLRSRRAAYSTQTYGDGDSKAPTKVEKIIRDSIKATGPMPFATYMQLCLSHPTDGYYMNAANPVFGTKGDFTTSPEISQLFGQLLAIWHLSRWQAAGAPPRIRLVELGPGRGTLMYDILHTFSQFAAAHAALRSGSVHLVETSGAMRQMQQEKLRTHALEGTNFVWHDSVEDVVEDDVPVEGLFTMVVANEFFDALPIHLLEKCADGWHEVLVGFEPESNVETVRSGTMHSSSLPRLRFVREPTPSAASKLLGASSSRFSHIPTGSRIEVSPASYKTAHKIAHLTNVQGSQGGSALIVDYGAEKAFGSSLRAFKNHKIVDIFETPGECDMTANVDFAYLREAIQGAATTHRSITQSAFLRNMALEAQLTKIVRAVRDPEHQLEIIRGARRLVDESGMGKQYMVLAITGKGKPVTDRDGGREDKVDVVWPFVEEKSPTIG